MFPIKTKTTVNVCVSADLLKLEAIYTYSVHHAQMIIVYICEVT